MVYHPPSAIQVLASTPHPNNSAKKTAFSTSGGQHYEFTNLPFRHCNAPATFARLMDVALQGLNWETCLAYLDDIIVTSRTWIGTSAHRECLAQAFKVHSHQTIRRSPWLHCFPYGHIPCLDKLHAISATAPPTNTSPVRTFIGMASYYPGFVPGFSKVTKLLLDLKKKN